MPFLTQLFVSSTVGFGVQGTSVLRGAFDGHVQPLTLDAEVVSLSEAHFAAYLAKHRRAYSKGTEEWNMRFSTYMKRVAQVERLNSRPGRSWTAGLNHFGDKTDAELRGLLGYKHDKRAAAKRVEESRKAIDTEDIAIRGDKDWSSELTSLEFIRDQGQCGSCWAVTASTVLDAHSEIHGTNRTFSTQHIVDCVPNPHKCGGTGGCDGATVELAFMYAMKKGLGCPESYGAYTAMDGDCSFSATNLSTPTLDSLTGFELNTAEHTAQSGDVGLSYGLIGWHRLATNRYAPLMQALQGGPVAISLAADELFLYSTGVFDLCTSFDVNHAVTLIGYGTDAEVGKDYWLVLNSWGSSWGENGKIRIERTSHEEKKCGMDDTPQDGVACEGETDPIEVCGTCGILFDSTVPTFNKNHVVGSDDLC